MGGQITIDFLFFHIFEQRSNSEAINRWSWDAQVLAISMAIALFLHISIPFLPSARMRSEGYCSRPVCVFVCPGRSPATHATKRQT